MSQNIRGYVLKCDIFTHCIAKCTLIMNFKKNLCRCADAPSVYEPVFGCAHLSMSRCVGAPTCLWAGLMVRQPVYEPLCGCAHLSMSRCVGAPTCLWAVVWVRLPVSEREIWEPSSDFCEPERPRPPLPRRCCTRRSCGFMPGAPYLEPYSSASPFSGSSGIVNDTFASMLSLCLTSYSDVVSTVMTPQERTDLWCDWRSTCKCNYVSK